MTKTRSRIKIIIIAIFIAIGLFLTFGSFVIPTTNTTYRGFFNAINYGYDIAGGRLSVYEVSDENSALALGNVSNKIDKIVGDYQSYFSDRGMNVTRQQDTIRIEISNFDNENIANIFSKSGFSVDLFDIIGSSEGIKFSKESSYSSVEEDALDGTYIASCNLLSSQTSADGTNYYPLEIVFTSEGQTKFKELTKSITSSDSDKLYIYVNGQNYTSSGMEISSAMSSFTLPVTSQSTAEALRLQILALSKPLLLEKVVDSTITASLDTSASSILGNTRFMLILALSLVLLCTAIYLIVRYRMLGLFGVLSIATFIVIYSFLLQSIPLIVVDVNGLIGVLMTYALLVIGMINIFDKIREEYSLGKKIPNSVTSGFKKNVLLTLEKYVFLVILCIIVFLVGTAGLKHMSFALFIGLLVNYFTLFAVLRGLCQLYLPINSTKKAYYNLRREAKSDE